MEEKQEVKRLRRVFGTVYFVQGMSSLPSLSIFFYMKNILQLGPVGGQIFSGLTSFAWFIKPLWGFISDRYPILGYHRKPYFVIMAAIALLSWLALGMAAYFRTTWVVPYILFFNTASMAYAFVDVVADALMVEHGQRLKKVGSFVNFQWLSIGFAGILVALFSGWFQQKIEEGIFSYWMIFSLAGFFPMLTAYVGIKNISEARLDGYGTFSIREIPPYLKTLPSKVFRWKLRRLRLISYAKSAWSSFRNFRKNYRTIWILMLFIIAWNFSPSIGYAARLYFVDELKFTPMIFGITKAANAFVWIFSIWLYSWFVKRHTGIEWDRYLYVMIAIGGLSLALGFYYYLPKSHSLSFTVYFPWQSILSYAESLGWKWVYKGLEFFANWNRYHWMFLLSGTLIGLVTMPAFLIPLTIAGEAASKENAGMIYALLMSVSNLTNSFEDIVGGGLYKLFTVSWMKWFISTFENSVFNIAGTHQETVLILQIFVYISAFFTFVALPFVLLAKKEFIAKGIKVHLASN